MGATFLSWSRRCAQDPGRGVGNLYAADLFGACAGVLSNAFLLLAFLGLAGAHWLGVALSAAAGLAALALDAKKSLATPPVAATAIPWHAVAAVFASGFCGMALETVWTRILVPSFNNSVYGFASVLFVFLLGLGIGSKIAAHLRRPAAGGAANLRRGAGVHGYLGSR